MSFPHSDHMKRAVKTFCRDIHTDLCAAHNHPDKDTEGFCHFIGSENCSSADEEAPNRLRGGKVVTE